MSPMAPTFTLRLDAPSVGCSNWALASSDPDPGIFPIVSMGPMDSISAKSWASGLIEHNTTYSVTGWVDVQPGTLTAELKHIRHEFRLTWPGLAPRVMHVKDQEAADEVERRILEGDNFIRLLDCNDRSVMVGLSQVQTITYEPTEVDL